MGGAGAKPCSTSLLGWRMGANSDPGVQLQTGQFKVWFRLWDEATPVERQEIYVAWRHIRGQLEENVSSRRWQGVTGPIGATIATLLGRGLINGDRNQTFILPGILESTGEANTLQINNSQYYFSNLLFGPKELTVYDASVLRLQEISLGYSLPQSAIDKTPFGAISFTATGFNLWYDAYNTPDAANFDPNVAGLGVGNGRGFDYLNGPSSKRYGLSVKLSF
jgi:hypothetical protein